MAEILRGFGCRMLAYDPYPADSLPQVRYVSLAELYRQSDLITLHLPLTAENRHMIDEESIAKMKDGVVLINVSRGELTPDRGADPRHREQEDRRAGHGCV